jgi:hypothetical protein
MSIQYFYKEISEAVILALALMFVCVTGNPNGDKFLMAAACLGIAVGTTAFKAVIAMSADVGHLYHYLDQQEADAAEAKGKKK